jgi:hypothetical protein
VPFVFSPSNEAFLTDAVFGGTTGSEIEVIYVFLMHQSKLKLRGISSSEFSDSNIVTENTFEGWELHRN